MAFLNINTPKPRQFQYRPRFYDERKERLEKMKARAEAELSAEKSGTQYIGLQRGFLSERRENSKLQRPALNRVSNMRVVRYVLILIFLMGLFYILSPELFLAFWKIK